MKMGDSASFSKTITESDINIYAGLTGDFNAVHINEEEAARGMFGQRIAHGMLAAGLISTVIGTKLPGDGAVYLSQNLNFVKPVLIGDTVTAVCTVVEVLNADKGIYRLETICVNQRGEHVLEGEAVIKYTGDHAENGEEPLALEQFVPGQPALEKGTGKRDGSFYSEEELKGLGLKRYGDDVRISRNAVLYHPELLEVGSHVRIDDFTIVSGRVVLGDYIHIAQFCGLYGGGEGIYMDDFSGLSSRVVIYAVSNDYSGESLTNPTVPAKYKKTDKEMAVHLCKHVIVGTTSVILPGVTIGEGSSVGALSMCSKDLEPWGVYAGSPARRVKERSKKLLELEKELRAEEG